MLSIYYLSNVLDILPNMRVGKTVRARNNFTPNEIKVRCAT